MILYETDTGAPNPLDTQSVDNLVNNQLKQIEYIYASLLTNALDWLSKLLFDTFRDAGITVSGFISWISIFATQLATTAFGDMLTRIGAAIEFIAESLKISADMSMALTDLALAGPTNVTGNPVTPNADGVTSHTHYTLPHQVKNIWGALTKITGYSTDHIGDIGEHIVNIGQFILNQSEMLFDVQHIGYALLSLGAQLEQYAVLIADILDRMVKAEINANIIAEQLFTVYTDQIGNKQAEIDLMSEYHKQVDTTNNAEPTQLIIPSDTGVSGATYT